MPGHVRTPKGFHQDLSKSFSQGPVQDHAKASDSISLGSNKDLPSASHKSFHTSPSKTWHLQAPHAKDFLERISPGSPQDLLLSTRSCKDLLERNFAGSSQEPFYARIYNENAAGPELENPAAHLRSLNAQHERLTRAIFWRELTGKMPRPHTLCVPAQSKLIWTSQE